MAINKVQFGNSTLIDTSNDTAGVEDVLNGATFHSRSGEQLTGTLTTHTYTAGDGINIANDVISVDYEDIAENIETVLTSVDDGEGNVTLYYRGVLNADIIEY